MVKFRCKISGNVISFEHEVDIVSTRENPAYEEVFEEKEVKEKVSKKAANKSSTDEV
ncbi:hypothetical protein UFOVP678_8 [uncultured Caudovirales phage]|jgi:hypothetical protein|uniref:Uncharacterized protein n=1 Tax=uncultured Caudovirales phage TaxID=2100421 RepID=A0A6J5NE59_9CAUD|nr:hypothetical protein UFOVP678_8 [uncultured Caudovirales phage]